MTQLGVRLCDVPETIGWDGLMIFIEHQPMGSAYVRELYPQEMAFASELKQAKMIADLIDDLTLMRYEFAVAMAGKGNKPDEPKPYPTPWNKYATEADPFNGAYGRDPISSLDFYDWYYGEEHGDGGSEDTDGQKSTGAAVSAETQYRG